MAGGSGCAGPQGGDGARQVSLTTEPPVFLTWLQVGIEQAQQRLLKCMVHLAPLLPIKLSVPELVKYVKMDIGPILLAQFLDGRTGMSYGFLAYQVRRWWW